MKPFVVGFNQGQYGDLFIGLTACSVIKSIWPSSTMIYSVNKKYIDLNEELQLLIKKTNDLHNNFCNIK